MKFSHSVLALLVLAGALAPAQAVRRSHHRTPPSPLVVGWHDEFNALEGWSPWTAFGGADILSGTDGTLRVTLGRTSMWMKEFGHYRAGVWKEFAVDLDRYPLLAVRVTRFHRGASWDIGLFEYHDKDAPDAREITPGGGIPAPGNPQGLAADLVADSSGRYRAETILVDVKSNPRRKAGKSHVRLLLNLSGPHQGATVDYAWVRFIRREDVERVRNNPTSHNVRLVEPE